MNMNSINTAARDIIRAYDLTPRSSRSTIDEAVATYCDNPDIDRPTLLRIRTRIESIFAN